MRNKIVLVKIIGKACIKIPYTIKQTQPHVLSHLNLISLVTKREMASKMDAAYPSTGTIISIINKIERQKY